MPEVHKKGNARGDFWLLEPAPQPRGASACVPGRYPGSQVLTRRLPRLSPSGILTRPHLLTVAGAAAELSLARRTAFPFNCAWRNLAQHLTRREFYMHRCCAASEKS